MDLIDYDWSQDWDCVSVIPINDTGIGDPCLARQSLEGYANWARQRKSAYGPTHSK